MADAASDDSLEDSELLEAVHHVECLSKLQQHTDQFLLGVLSALFKERPTLQKLLALSAPRTPRQGPCGSDSFGPMLQTPPRAAKRTRLSWSQSEVLQSRCFFGKVSAIYIAKGYGFIKSPELIDSFDCDAMVLASQLGSYKVGDKVTFQVSLNGDGKAKAYNLQTASTPATDANYALACERSSKQAVQVLMNEASGAEALRMWRAALQNSSISIRIAAFGMDQAMLEQCYVAAGRGVKVFVLLDLEHQINQTNLPLAYETQNMMVKYTPSSTRLHAKTLVVDSEDLTCATMVTGSANATRFSSTSIEWVMWCKMYDGCSASAQYLIEDSASEFDRLWQCARWLSAPAIGIR